MTDLTQSERDIIDCAFSIIERNTPKGAQWSIGILNGWQTVSYFRSDMRQYSFLNEGKTVSEAIMAGVQIQLDYDANADTRKAEEAAKLKDWIMGAKAALEQSNETIAAQSRALTRRSIFCGVLAGALVLEGVGLIIVAIK